MTPGDTPRYSAWTISQPVAKLSEQIADLCRELAPGPGRLPVESGLLGARLLAASAVGDAQSLSSWIRESSSLCVIPHGELAALPLHALLLPDSNSERQYVGVATAVHYATSTKALLRSVRGRAEGATVEPRAALFTGLDSTLPFSEWRKGIQGVFPLGQAGPLPAKAILSKDGYDPIIYVLAHGVTPSASETPFSSGFRLDDGNVVTAESLARRGRRSDFVHLDVCHGGRQSVQGGDLSGLPFAALTRSRTMLAPIELISGKAAHRFSKAFYARWLAGDVSIADAIRECIEQQVAEGASLNDWAPYWLWGDPMLVCRQSGQLGWPRPPIGTDG